MGSDDRFGRRRWPFPNGNSVIHPMRLSSTFSGNLEGLALRQAPGTKATTVAALVMFDHPTQSARTYARYPLKVNGMVQSGG